MRTLPYLCRDWFESAQGRDGTTYLNGAYNAGTIFRLTLTGQLTTLHWFRGNEDGAFSSAGLVQARDGNFSTAPPPAVVPSGTARSSG